MIKALGKRKKIKFYLLLFLSFTFLDVVFVKYIHMRRLFYAYSPPSLKDFNLDLFTIEGIIS